MGCPTALDPERPFKIGLPGSEVREKRTLAKRRRFRQNRIPALPGATNRSPDISRKGGCTASGLSETQNCGNYFNGRHPRMWVNQPSWRAM